ncbi:uncharacterized protein At1g76070-like [Argentina anserina]|uniref:uncharacterized protein At1g76070-like n=1 Tax=Argentina anserina TaxID=57926 RepID=UPI00217672B5|nr:uncharacterized protein At1g76070-like [Potentilla anserina]
MEKQTKLSIQILKFLSQAAAPAVTYKGSPASPRHPVVSIIPKEARRKQSESSRFSLNEPTSPKVSCMGQVKGRNKKKKKSKPKAKQVSPPPPPAPAQESTSLALCVPKEKTFKVYMIPKALIDEGNTKDDATVATSSLSRNSSAPERVPSLGQMKRFDSRSVLSDFDLLKLDDDRHRLDNLKIGLAGEEEDEEKKNKKEVLLWKRRSLSPPTPLQL